ncbi:MAG TPA: flagellar biosynthetic protein FliQ [Anaerohalosphaeraceae bacterium]|jgi:flagellar biosynthetic protein FliQ|nr:flagellar biosynthetic protein FliQ [Anaerohalosphaeraceae bacterium]HRT49449.1 flagellar biosynthetic protein FliQ [Anaerohalosphaeraceae bacterium]HRT85387.1 flagellar biosynthetic protein FliQ [Anaerohalosphaeraceae bacterium]
MDASYILYLGRHTLETALIVSSPILLVSIISGLVISLFQAVTALKDMTLTLVPKLLAIGITTLVFANWMMQVIVKFTLEIFNQIQSYGR